MPDFKNSQIQWAFEAVRQSAELAREVQQHAVHAVEKSDASPVTVADFAIQAVIAEALVRHAGGVLVAEEDSKFLRSEAGKPTLEKVTGLVRKVYPHVSAGEVCDLVDQGDGEPCDHFWTLDPIDGTRGFLRGDQYAIALALVEHGKVQAGILGCPKLKSACEETSEGPGSLVAAVRGQGAWCTSLEATEDWKPLHVSVRQKAEEAVVLRSFEQKHTHVSRTQQILDQMGITKPVRPMDSLAKYAVLAAGGGDILCRIPSAKKPDYRENIWDQAAGAVVVEEAGGKITDLHGKPLDFSQGRKLSANVGVLATNGRFHNAVLRAISSIL